MAKGFVSDIDLLLAKLEKTVAKPASRIQEEQRYKEIFRKRDYPDPNCMICDDIR